MYELWTKVNPNVKKPLEAVKAFKEAMKEYNVDTSDLSIDDFCMTE